MCYLGQKVAEPEVTIAHGWLRGKQVNVKGTDRLVNSFLGIRNFVFGGASNYDGSALSAYENIVVVIIQYRFGLLGFFNTGSEHAFWENTEHFGGDPGSVTLFGVSVGSCCVFLTVLVFVNNFEKIANIFKCETNSSLSLINCLRNQEEKGKILLTSNLMFFLLLQEIPFLPLVLDGIILHKSPEDILAGKEFNMVLFMIGVTNNEFGWNIRSRSRTSWSQSSKTGSILHAELSVLYGIFQKI
uniref:Carboxylesterase type B domain-containing protein n=1 Tax=Meleagris gallopavo TaxID=9103 RepID=G3UR65_MELGA